MDGILNDVDDFEGFLDLPNEFNDDILLEDLDSLDFINDLDGNLIYDCDIDLPKQQSDPNNYVTESDIRHNTNIVTNISSNNNYRNGISNGFPMVFNNNMQNKESCAPGHNMIRELLSSDTGARTNVSYMSPDRNNSVNKHHHSNNHNSQVHNNRQPDNRNITPKHPNILPATSIASAHLLRTPTLAATLIGIQPSSNNDNIDADSSSYGSGKVVRRNSHNAIEKRYRLSINDRIDELRHMLALGDNSKMNKSAVLRKAVERIRALEQENNSLKCDNFNLRKTIVSGSSNESLNHTGSSPLSNQSDSGHSITNSPSSSSMHSTSVASSFLFFKNNENQSCLVNNSNKGVKRPLIYDNTVAPMKTEKLARLLLSSSDSYDDKQQGYLKDIQNDQNQSKRLHSSNVPSFLLCTMALFVVAFQPLDIILNNYRTKTLTSTRGRRILQGPESSDQVLTDSLVLTVALAMSHWLLAFLLVWSSTNNRYLLTKLTSFLIGKVHSMTFIAFYYNGIVNGYGVENVEQRVTMWRQDPVTFDSQLKDQLRLYHCQCPVNIFMFFIQLYAVLYGIVVSYIPFTVTRTRPDKEAHKVALSLLTSAVEQFTMSNGFCRLESLWYKVVLFLAIRLSGCEDRTMVSKLILTQCIPIDFIRRYLVSKYLNTTLTQVEGLPQKYHCLLTSVEIQKLFVKHSLRKMKQKLSDNYLMVTMTSDTMRSYYMAYIQDSLSLVVKKLLTKDMSPQTDDTVKDIIRTSSNILGEDESRYINTLCNFVVSLVDCGQYHNMDDMVNKLLCYYNKMLGSSSTDETTRTDIKQMIYSLRLFSSTLRMSNGNDNEVHDANLNFISHITETPLTNIITRLIFATSLDGIISSLNGQQSSLSSHNSDIYYVDRYSTQLRDYSDQHITGCESSITKFKMLFQSLCQINPIKSGSPTIECKETRKCDNHCYRVTDLLSLDGSTGHRDYNNLKMRSH